MTSPLGSVATEDGRYYERHGKRYISVTNVLEKAISKPALVPWAVKLTAEAALADFHAAKADPQKLATILSYPDTVTKPKVNPASEWKRKHTQVKDASADRGSAIHDWAEKWVLGLEPDPVPGEELACVGIIRAFEKYGIEPLAAESTVYNNAHDYAGTCDLFATVAAFDGATAVLDYKTGKSAWPETALQLAAYRFGEFIGLPDDTDIEVPQASRAGVLHVRPTETVLIPYTAGVQEFTVFLNALSVARWVVEESGNVIGAIV